MGKQIDLSTGKKIPEFSDIGHIAGEIFKLKKDGTGLFLLGDGRRRSPLTLSKALMGLVFVYYKKALVSMQENRRLPADYNELELDDIMNEIVSPMPGPDRTPDINHDDHA